MNWLEKRMFNTISGAVYNEETELNGQADAKLYNCEITPDEKWIVYSLASQFRYNMEEFIKYYDDLKPIIQKEIERLKREKEYHKSEDFEK